MPLYEYECDTCGHRFEVIQKFSDPLVDKCPKCGSPVHKLISSPAIQFKGSGWYITDYAKKDAQAPAKGGTTKDGATKDGAAKDGGTKEGGGSASSDTASSSSGDSAPASPAPAAAPAKSE
ncbi:MAG TPA: FmdB family zinc ribbon protein [Vicinamibacterales bacterium]|nr:FmdB family zinc ribbon protein [Vicinamibacterales bacterium]